MSRRPALFDIFKSRSRGEAKKQPSIMQQVKAAVQVNIKIIYSRVGKAYVKLALRTSAYERRPV